MSTDEVYLRGRVGRRTCITVSFSGPVSRQEIAKAIKMLDILAEGMPQFISIAEADRATTDESLYLEIRTSDGAPEEGGGQSA